MDLLSKLIKIVGEDRVSNSQEELFIYSRDSGAQHPRKTDYVVMPKTVDEVQKVIILANKEKIPVTPLGGGFTLSALVVPNRAGIVLDMKRMDKIIEVNEINRYAVVEAGVSQGALKMYLGKKLSYSSTLYPRGTSHCYGCGKCPYSGAWSYLTTIRG